MPIIEEGNDVHVEYSIPEDIKKLITDDFLKEFRNQLFRIHEHYSLEVFAEEGIPVNTSTSGWFAAFGKACLLTHKETVLDYWRTLPWYDSDIFNSELAEMLIDRHFILGDLSKVIEEQLAIKESDLRVCNDCGKLYSKEMVIEIAVTDEEERTCKYRCLYCQDVKDLKEGNPHATDYYRGILKELDDYEEKHPIKSKEE